MQVLIALSGEQVAVVERFLAEIGQQRIARMIDLDREAAVVDRLGIVLGGSGLRRARERALERGGAQLLDQFRAARVVLCVHRHCRGIPRLHCFRNRCLDFGHRRFVSVPEIHLQPPCSRE